MFFTEVENQSQASTKFSNGNGSGIIIGNQSKDYRLFTHVLKNKVKRFVDFRMIFFDINAANVLAKDAQPLSMYTIFLPKVHLLW